MFLQRQGVLFWELDGNAAFQAQISGASAAVRSLPEERILNTELEALVQYFVEKYHVEVPTLDLDNVEASEREQPMRVQDAFGRGPITVPGAVFSFEIPFSGDAEIFRMRPNTYDSSAPEAQVQGQRVCFSIAGHNLTETGVKQEFEKTRDSIQKYLNWHREMWSHLDDRLATAVRAEITARRDRLAKQKRVAAGLAAIGVKLKEKPGDPHTYVPAEIKQKIVPVLPPMRPSAAPDPALDQSQYDTILTLIRGAGRSIEQSSSRTRSLDEEALRDMLLVPLNAHFGQATGEAFNFTGKTDILVRHGGGNIFVAECKIWNGDKHFLSTMDQLLGYLTWRDTKTALIVFNRNVAFSNVVEKLRALPSQHPSYVSGPVRLDDTSFRFTLKLPQDPGRQVVVSILGFDLGS